MSGRFLVEFLHQAFTENKLTLNIDLLVVLFITSNSHTKLILFEE